MYRIFVPLLVLALSLTLTTTGFTRSGIQPVDENTKIDWTNHFFIATGEGAMPSVKEEPNRARAYLKAKTYARMAAVANLIMAAEGTSIDYESNGEDFTASETLRQKIKGMAKVVQVLETRKEKVEDGTIVVVKVKAPMPAEMRQEPVKAASIPAKVPVQVASLPDQRAWNNPPQSGPGAYTSLIIDARGCGLERCMSPKIRTADGSEVWGTLKVDYDFLQDRGIVAYATSMSAALNNERCGSNPMVIRAHGRAAGRLHTDPVVSQKDADLVMNENAKHKFLDNFRVIFVKD